MVDFKKIINVITKNKFYLFSALFFTTLLILRFTNNYDSSFLQNNDILSTIDKFQFTPLLSLWLYSLTTSFIGMEAVLILGNVIMPTLCFFMLCKLFDKYISPLWSISLSSLALVSYGPAFPFREFLLLLFSGAGWREINTDVNLQIIGFPIPSLSLFLFLLLLFVTLNFFNIKNLKQGFLFTSLWTLFFQVHPVDALFGIIFWFSFLGIRLFRLNSTATFFKIFSGHLILSSFLFIPVLLDTEFHSLKLEIPSSEGIPLYTLVSYFVIPIVLIFANYLAHRIDPYEILIKFWHVYLLMITEFILLFSSINLGWGIHADILENRIPLFFLHFYYYVPFLYYTLRPYREFEIGSESGYLSQAFRKAGYLIFSTYKITYLPIFLFLLGLFLLV